VTTTTFFAGAGETLDAYNTPEVSILAILFLYRKGKAIM